MKSTCHLHGVDRSRDLPDIPREKIFPSDSRPFTNKTQSPPILLLLYLLICDSFRHYFCTIHDRCVQYCRAFLLCFLVIFLSVFFSIFLHVLCIQFDLFSKGLWLPCMKLGTVLRLQVVFYDPLYSFVFAAIIVNC